MAYGEPKQFKGDVAKLTDADLIVAQFSQDEWLVPTRPAGGDGAEFRPVMARESRSPSTPPRDAEFKAVSAGDSATFLKKLWAIHALGGFTDDDIVEMRDRLNPYVVGWYVRLATDGATSVLDTAKAIASLAGVNFQQSPRVDLARVDAKLPAELRHTFAMDLLRNAVDANQDLAVSYGIESLVVLILRSGLNSSRSYHTHTANSSSAGFLQSREREFSRPPGPVYWNNRNGSPSILSRQISSRGLKGSSYPPEPG